MKAPNPRPGVPLHEQITAWIRAGIDAGEWPADARLPSENELRDLFGVSRVTVRRALQTLEADGLIYRRHGLGSFVCARQAAQSLVRLTDFAQDTTRAGMEPSSVVLHRANEQCPSSVAERLGMVPGATVLRIDRLRLGDGEPIAIDRTWVPPYYAQLLEGHDLVNETLYQVLEREHGIPVLGGRYRITAGVADPRTAASLGVQPGDPLLVLDRTTRTIGERAIYFQRRSYRADRMAYELEAARDPGQPGVAGDDAGGMPLREFEAVTG